MKLLTTWSKDRIWRRSQVKVRRKYKDQLFQRIFSNRKDLLDLYNAVNNTSYTNPNELEITTLEDVIYLSMKNDLSFIISSTMNLYEQQSTFNPNMPLRGLFYFSRLYETYAKKQEEDLYGRTLMKLPAPQYIVFYVGKEDIPDEMELKLSDAFVPRQEAKEVVLECKARVLNINYGHNQPILDACKRLHDYSYFVEEVNRNLAGRERMDVAINRAIDSCIEKGVLTDILEKCRSEVFHMILTEYDEKKHLRNLRAEAIREGREEGLQKLNTLNSLLIEQNRLEDVIKATKNKKYQEKLFKEFGL